MRTKLAWRGELSGGAPAARRIVIKVGSSSLTTVDDGINVEALLHLVDACQQLRDGGTEVVLVSSGAIAAGLAPLSMPSRPTDLAAQQAAAAVGQGLLLAHYTQGFARHGSPVAQVLLTVEDLIRRATYTNALRSLEKLLALGAVPVVNENDAVATAEIRFGDNDRLAALTANLLHADALVMLSDVDALFDGPPSQGGSPLRYVRGEQDLTGVTSARAAELGCRHRGHGHQSGGGANRHGPRDSCDADLREERPQAAGGRRGRHVLPPQGSASWCAHRMARSPRIDEGSDRGG